MFLTDNELYQSMSKALNPYGNGMSAKIICDYIIINKIELNNKL